MTGDQELTARDIAEAAMLVAAAIDEVGDIETDAAGWGDEADEVEEAAGEAREALERLKASLDAAHRQLR